MVYEESVRQIADESLPAAQVMRVLELTHEAVVTGVPTTKRLVTVVLFVYARDR